MDDVIENCQTTFEEDGVNQQTLDDLRKVGRSLSYHSLSWSNLLSQISSFVPGSSPYMIFALSIFQIKRFMSFQRYFTPGIGIG